MGHRLGGGVAYSLLRERLDQNVTGAPDSPEFRKILRLLFTPEEADLARQIPTRPVRLESLSRRVGIPAAELEPALTRMAAKGLVFDMEVKGVRRFSLAPVVIGFFEFTFMRVRDDVPVAELARLFEDYFFENGGRFAQAVFGGDTQIGRSLVRESALPEGSFAEILDWERATRLVETARTVGVSECACRHHASHLGAACDAPRQVCMTLNSGAETLMRGGIARQITNAEGLRILAECQAAGLAQTADNVQKGVGYICNCCGCCCGMMRASKTFGLAHAIVSSSWIAAVNAEKCSGCGLCVKACPPGALTLEAAAPRETDPPRPEGAKPRKKASLAADLCLGCGVCATVCKKGGVAMEARPARVFTPENTFDRMLAMAIERGKLANLLAEDPESLTWQAIARVVRAIESAAPVKAALAIRPLRSAFLGALLPLARLGAGSASSVE